MSFDELVSVFLHYPDGHPLRTLSEIHEKYEFPFINPDSVAAHNVLVALNNALDCINAVSKEAYNDILFNKLKADDKGAFNRQNYLSELCELAITYSFILASDKKETFVYEPKVVDGSKKNPEFAIEIGPYKYIVEVKTPDLLTEYENLLSKFNDSDTVIESDVRVIPKDVLDDIGKSYPVQYSLDNKVLDFLKYSNQKFPSSRDDRTIHLLVICWDNKFDQALSALKSPACGLMTKMSYFKDSRTGEPIAFPNISHIVVNQMLQRMVEWGLEIQYTDPALVPTIMPFSLKSYEDASFLIDYNLDNPKEIKESLDLIVGQNHIIVDESYAAKFPEQRVITKLY